MRYDHTPGQATETLALFGQARIVKDLDGRLELDGGTAADRQEALAWLESFMPGVRLGEPKAPLWPRRGRRQGPSPRTG